MIGDKNILVDYRLLSEGLVRFGNGATTKDLGKGKLLISMVFHGLKIFCMLIDLRLI